MKCLISILVLCLWLNAWGQSVGQAIQQSPPLKPLPVIPMPLLSTNVGYQCQVPESQARHIRVEYNRPAAVFWHHANGSTNWLQCTNEEHVYIDVICTKSNEQFVIGANTLTNYILTIQ